MIINPPQRQGFRFWPLVITAIIKTIIFLVIAVEIVGVHAGGNLLKSITTIVNQLPAGVPDGEGVCPRHIQGIKIIITIAIPIGSRNG